MDAPRSETFAAGQTLFHAGDAADRVYLIEEGRVELCAPSGGSERRIALLERDELVGEAALVDGRRHTVTARATTRVVALSARRDFIEAFLKTTDPLVRRLLCGVFKRLGRMPDGQASTGTEAFFMPFELPLAADGILDNATRDQALADDIAYALAADQFAMHYQPICSLADGHIVGFEALIRWHHPREGLIAPLDFLGLAEQTGQISAIGLWTLEQACRDWPRLKAQTGHSHPFVSVNLSSSQLTGPHFVDEVKTLLQRHRMPPAEMQMELDESAVLVAPDSVTPTLRQWTGLGGKLALTLDDLTVGDSCLASLPGYPIATLKIGRPFIGGLLESRQRLDILRQVIAKSHALGMDVAAEGVENAAIRQLLLALDCDFGQGWLFGRPLAPAGK